MYPKLNLPLYTLRTRSAETGDEIFDPIRKKYLLLTPEEWVRQNFIQFLILEKGYPSSLLMIETALAVNKLKKRTDIVACDNSGNPILVVECKATNIKITQDVFDQIARYNMTLKVKYLVVTNGLEHYCCEINHKNSSYSFLKDIPDYKRSD